MARRLARLDNLLAVSLRDGCLVLVEGGEVSEWIKCSERMPDESELVDCWSDQRIPDCKIQGGEWHYWTEYGDYEYNPHFEPHKNIEVDAAPITHWMPIPEPPK